jgi:hypothetical protein
VCRRCGEPIKRGDEAFFYKDGSLYCDRGCGQDASADFEAAAFDEDVAGGCYY